MEEKDRYHRLIDAIEIERKHEEDYFRKISTEKSTKEKETAGVLWHRAEITAKHYTIGEHIELELERTRLLNNNHKFKTGAGAIVHFDADERHSYKGVISNTKRNKIRIILSGDVILKEHIVDHGTISIELIYDERPYRIMKSSIEKVISSKEPNIVALRNGLLNQELINDRLKKDAEHYQSSQLNTSQNESIRGVSEASYMGIIHGPPGTGKTTTLVALAKFLLKSEKQILVCAPSNNAVDLLAKRLSDDGVEVLRLGNVSRIGDNIGHLTLGEKAREHTEWQHIKKVKIEAENARKMAAKYKRSFGSEQRSNRNMMYKESKELRKWAKDLEAKLMEKIITESQVICSTLVGVENRVLQDVNFKTLIIDEASQSLEAECWTAILKAQRVILAGDHMQLPPTVKSMEAGKMGLNETMLSRMANHVDTSFLLKEQYRMNDKILSFSNKKFYDNALTSHESVINHQLGDDDKVVQFIDTSGCGFEENINPEFRSYYNEGEFFILTEHALQNQKYLNLGNVGIISPYAEQVRFIRDKIKDHDAFKNLDVVVDTIDGFQGQEKDTIYISLVRSNDRSEIGFLKDARRLNVALTRAKKKLVVIGDGATLTAESLYLELVEHVEAVGHYQSAWEYMG